MKILILDRNHPYLNQSLEEKGHSLTEAYDATYEDVTAILSDYDGLVIRSRIPIDQNLLEQAPNLRFIARVGAGMENIDVAFAESRNIVLLNAPKGNKDAVAEHALGMLLMLLHRLKIADAEVRKGVWKREENRGIELMGKTVGILGYGVMGNAFAQRLQGFEVEVICYDIKPNLGNENATQVDLETFFNRTDIVSLHVPLTELTEGMVNSEFIAKFKKDFYLINTARGKCVHTQDLNNALTSGKIKGACLDTLEHEKSSFEMVYDTHPEFQRLLAFPNVILSPHIAGWSHESNLKLAEIIVEKIDDLDRT